MDLLAHALYGVTGCSRLGLAGGREGLRARRWYREPTVWWSAMFGLAPDIVSMWVPFAVHVMTGPEEHFFHHFGGNWLVVYRAVHGLVVAAAVSAALLVWRRSLFVPSLAWTLHVLVDAVSHGQGKFQTMLFYPLSEWGIPGFSWWRTPWLFLSCWGVLAITWLALVLWRRTAGRDNREEAELT